MAEGRIKWFSEKEGYGFIETDENVDIFFWFTPSHIVRKRSNRLLETVDPV